jgi:hypothetical protein
MNNEQLKQRLRAVKNLLWRSSEVNYDMLLLIYEILEEIQNGNQEQDNRKS